MQNMFLENQIQVPGFTDWPLCESLSIYKGYVSCANWRLHIQKDI